jgi:lipid II:glycine glycyltransferase (peptidoglycan interpeptide bridge formation enzyme)
LWSKYSFCVGIVQDLVSLTAIANYSLQKQNMNNTQLNSPFEIEYCKQTENPEWDQFLSGIPGVCSSQSSLNAIASIQHGDSIGFSRIIIRKNRIIVGGVQVLIRRYFGIGKIGCVFQGPCIQSDYSEVEEIIVRQLKGLLKRENLLYLTVDVFYNHPQIIKRLTKEGFIKASRNMPPYQMVESTLVLDLTQSEDDLFNQFDVKRRKNIKSGLKHTFDARVGTREDIPMFLDLINKTCQRRNTNPLVDSVDYFYSVWDAFSPRNQVMLHLADVNGKTICGTFCYTFGDTFCADLWGWNGEHSKEKISETYFWHLIRWAKNNGFKKFDFVHLDKKAAHAIESGLEIPEEIKKRPLYSASHFKLRWGGRILDYPGHYTLFRNGLIKILLTILFKTYDRIHEK